MSSANSVAPAQRAACNQLHSDYKQCLAKSGRTNFSACTDFHAKLRACESMLGTSYCIEEGINLMKCTKNPDASYCAKEFVAMRECHRPGGPHIVVAPATAASPARYELRPEVKHLYNVSSTDLGAAVAPQRNMKQLDEVADALKTELNLPGFGHVPYKWESLRPNPGA
ncbi:hypothetical protein BESB_068710 [Besnoitia besnoiti]|uniref:Uncharacterized protein n=1 Tax=Besnoitia besnoiti TaxID=94643 RepID=A0A2A9M8N3_BESBE|nr:hypothetical protein BESB_068710 [Besnoitia besnoiti]PFH34838.1 hypothetical protein BESB_068710 [Besnoitia besnoiti]